MRWRLAIVALVVVAVGSFTVAVGASGHHAVPAATCMLHGSVPCLTDSQCTPYSAICDVQSAVCVCANTDMGSDLGAADLAGADLSGGGGGGGGGSGGVFGSTVTGGGMTGPLKTGGCSFVPGTR